MANRPEVSLHVRLAPGDLSILNNHTQVHVRSAYRDWEVRGRLGGGWVVGAVNRV